MDGDVRHLKGLENPKTPSDSGAAKETLAIQLSEFEMLQSMFSNPGEISLDDHSVLAHFKNYINGTTSLIPNRLDFVVHLVDSYGLELWVALPVEYPNIEPELFIRSSKLNRVQQNLINSDLSDYVGKLDRGEICVCSAISWLQENCSRYLDHSKEAEEVEETVEETPNAFSRLWIYSHHIYSKAKRREILDLAREFNLTGFSLPGRPGIVCVEGIASDCEQWWSKVKNMTWKKIICKKKEEEEIDNLQMNKLRKFPDFKEISFECKGKRRDYHMDFGEFYRYLVNHGCEYMFREFFGVEGK